MQSVTLELDDDSYATLVRYVEQLNQAAAAMPGGGVVTPAEFLAREAHERLQQLQALFDARDKAALAAVIEPLPAADRAAVTTIGAALGQMSAEDRAVIDALVAKYGA
jgi:hypothetical protein